MSTWNVLRSSYQCFLSNSLRTFHTATGNMTSRVDQNIHMVKDIWGSALRSVEPTQMVKSNLYCDGDVLKVGRGNQLQSIDLRGKNCHVVAFGKAVIGMVSAVDSVLGSRITSGLASIPKNIQKELRANGRSDLLPGAGSSVQLCEGAYLNIPDKSCVQTSEHIQHLVTELTDTDVLITLTSGGGSALLCLPVPPLTLQDLADTTRSLAKAGATIVELNTVRKHLEVLKGGGLAQLAQPAQVINLILSDIVGDPLDCIASGPTVPDSSTSADALEVIEKYIPKHKVRQSVRDVLQHNRKELLLQSWSSLTCTPKVHNIIIGSNSICLEAAVQRCLSLSVVPVLLTSQMCGNATQVGKDVAQLADRVIKGSNHSDYMEGLFNDVCKFEDNISDKIRQAVAKSREQRLPLCLLFGGETTVEVTGSGQGGRNQEMCLSSLIAMNSLSIPSDAAAFASIGTDGQDGPTDAAGAIITAHCSDGSDLEPLSFLANNDSYTYFKKLHDSRYLINSGLTGTNVMDLGILLLNLDG